MIDASFNSPGAKVRVRAMRALARISKALLVIILISSPLRAGAVGERPRDLLEVLRQRVQGIRGYAVTIHYTKRTGNNLKQNVVRYESWGASENIRIRYLEGERAGVEAFYIASQHRLEVKFPNLPLTLSFNPDDLGGDRRIYETDLYAIVRQLQSPGWEIKDFSLNKSLEWPAWALTMENRFLGQRVVLMVDQRQWLPRRIERFKSDTSDYEVWKFEDYLLEPPSQIKFNKEVVLSNNG